MTTFAVTVKPGASITGLSTSTAGLAVQFNWNAQLPTEKVQVFKGTSTTRSSATFLGATYDHNYQDALNAGSGTFYYWLSIINDWGGVGPEQGPFTVTVSGSSASLSPGQVTTTYLATNAAQNFTISSSTTAKNLMTGATVSGSTTSNSGTLFTATVTGNGYPAIFTFSDSVSQSWQCGSTSDSLSLYYTCQITDTTNSTQPNGSWTYYLLQAQTKQGTIEQINMPNLMDRQVIPTLTAGHTYQYNVTYNVNMTNLSGNAAMSALSNNRVLTVQEIKR